MKTIYLVDKAGGETIIEYNELSELQAAFSQHSIEVHPTVKMGDHVIICYGVKIGAWCVISDWCKLHAYCELGYYCILVYYCELGYYCRIGDNCRIFADVPGGTTLPDNTVYKG
jgi:UDP-3-O-[3-hydroxymyristoyl] glucosamine N-acyltransferase